MDSNLKEIKKETKKKKLTAQDEMGLVLIIGCFLLLVLFYGLHLGGELVFVNTYNITSPVEIETYDMNTRFMDQTIQFEDESGEWVVWEDALYEGSTDADVLYVYRIGKWDWMSNMRVGYKYLITNNPIEEENNEP